MRDNEKVEFGRIWTDCWSFYGKGVTAGILDLAFQALRRFELSDISAALSRHMNDPDAGQFAPKPADVVRNIDGAKGSRAMQAWARVDRAIRSVGTYQSVVFDDPIIHAVIAEMGGWIALGKVAEDEWPFKAREFEKRYQGYVLRQPTEYPRVLIGIAQAYNEQNKQRVSAPLVIGNESRALLVYQGGSDSDKPIAKPMLSLANKAAAALSVSSDKRSA